MCLKDKSILVNLSIHKFGTTRTDTRVTAEVLYNKSACGDSGSWKTKLLPKDCTKAIDQIDNSIRKHHRLNTLPWSDKGSRILPSKNFDKYMSTLRSLHRERDELVEAFKRMYPTYLADAQRRQGALYNPDHYPSAEDAAAHFELKVSASPIPDSDDFRVALGSEAELEQIKADLDAEIKAAESNATVELFQRLCEPLAKIVERLSDPEAKFKDSLVGNLNDIVELVPHLNVTDNTKLLKIVGSIKQQLSYYTPDALRSSPTDRSQAAAKAQNILDQAQAWMPAT